MYGRDATDLAPHFNLGWIKMKSTKQTKMSSSKPFEKRKRSLLLTLFTLAILLSCLSLAAYAQEETAPAGAETDYSNPENYNSPEFYKTSDPAQWDYTKVDWTKVDYNNPNLLKTQQAYSQQGFYDNLPAEKYWQIDYKQVDYDKISQDKVDSAKYFQDTGCKDCSLDKGQQSLKFSANGIQHPAGDSVTIPGTYPAGTSFKATDKGIEILMPMIEGKNYAVMQEMPKGDRFTINAEGGQVQMPGGNYLWNGKLSVKNDQQFVSDGDTATLNGIKINAEYGDVDVYYDGQEHKGDTSYVSFGDKRFLAEAGEGQGLSIDVTKSRYVTGSGERLAKSLADWKDEENDLLTFRFKDKGSIEINDRSENNQMPLVKGNDYYVTDGRKTYRVSGDEFMLQPKHIEGKKEGHGSVPIAIEMADKDIAVFFSNANTVHMMTKKDAAEIDSSRQQVLEKYGIYTYGFYGKEDLENLNDGLFRFVDQNDIDLRKISFKDKDIDDNVIDVVPFSLYEANEKIASIAAQTAGPVIQYQREEWVKDKAIFQFGPLFGFGKEKQETLLVEVPVHEFGHVLEICDENFDTDSPDSMTSHWHDMQDKYGIEYKISDRKDYPPSKGDHAWGGMAQLANPLVSYETKMEARGAYPSAFASYFESEDIAETTRLMHEDPEWFTNPDTVDEKYIEDSTYVNFDTPAYQEFKKGKPDNIDTKKAYALQIRQDKKAIIQNEMSKYKKDTSN